MLLTLTPGFTVEQQIVSTVGEIPFDTVEGLTFTLDGAGQLGTIGLALNAGANTQCSLDLEAGPELDANGGLVVTTFSIVASGNPCPGFPPVLPLPYSTHFPGGTFVGSVRLDGFACEARLPGDISARPCFAGSIEVDLNGTLEPRPTLSFEDAVLRLTGHACSGQL